MNLVPNISATSFTLSATVIGFVLIEELNANEQNALGNWFMLIGQVLCTNSSQQSVLNQRNRNLKDILYSTDNFSEEELMKKAVDAINSQISKT